MLYDVDYQASTVHENAVDSDGTPNLAGDPTISAKITDGDIDWSDQITTSTGQSQMRHMILNRYSGAMSMQISWDDDGGHHETGLAMFQCNAWTGQKPQKRF